jgi:hypothetical protein
VYERNFLLACRNSPLAKSPPKNLLEIPGITCPAKPGKENGDATIKEADENKGEQIFCLTKHWFLH